ncbi:MAG TPA: PilZ domain-containing protein, partial [Acidobacteriota bacterium]
SREGLQQMGVTVNISRRGMCFATTEVFRKRNKLRILLAAADDIYALTGTVVWSGKRRALPGDGLPAGVGIHIQESVPGYKRYVRSILRTPPRRPKKPA